MEKSLALSLQEWDLLLNALRFAEDTYDSLNARLGSPYDVLGDSYLDLRLKIDLYLDSHSGERIMLNVPDPTPLQPFSVHTETMNNGEERQ
ncbi:hypothetical protein ICL81_01360 [Leucobacter sp. cx-328]|nr:MULTISPECIES: hypothetical protein [unclassified Leucobacter]MBC9943177.1 hypothetical protein [Leucobacter sp. cx-328]MBL5974506.1 hypothetical protein [Candidatus Leucobacter sulfamidivorax]